MVHGALTGVYTGQGGPRGDDMAFVESMAMLSASRNLGDSARFEFRTMMSLEPAMGQSDYPNLFASSETAHGAPLVDRQHPHDLFMELSARVDVDIAKDTSLFIYGGPVAEPALGPSAFMHRRSARYLVLSPISHHWFDSTHVTYGVVTAGGRHRPSRSRDRRSTAASPTRSAGISIRPGSTAGACARPRRRRPTGRCRSARAG